MTAQVATKQGPGIDALFFQFDEANYGVKLFFLFPFGVWCFSKSGQGGRKSENSGLKKLGGEDDR